MANTRLLDPTRERRMPALAAVWRSTRVAAIASALTLGAASASAARAQVAATTDYLARMDTDGDGRVSLAEYQAWMGYAFERMDRNADGVLTPDELPGGRGAPVSLADHRARLAEAFARQDANRDGALDARELAAPPPR